MFDTIRYADGTRSGSITVAAVTAMQSVESAVGGGTSGFAVVQDDAKYFVSGLSEATSGPHSFAVCR